MIMSVLTRADEDLDLMTVTERMKIEFGKEWKLQTVATFMQRLLKKGYIDIYRIGRYSHYKVLITRDEMLAHEFETLRKIYGPYAVGCVAIGDRGYTDLIDYLEKLVDDDETPVSIRHRIMAGAVDFAHYFGLISDEESDGIMTRYELV